MPTKVKAKKGGHRKVFVPNRLQELRERGRGKSGSLWLTAAEVARFLGVTEATVSRHESNDPTKARGLTDALVLEYAKLYKVDPLQIFKGLTDSPNGAGKHKPSRRA